MKALNQYTFSGAVTALFLVVASYYAKFATLSASMIGLITVGVFSSSIVLFLTVQFAYQYFFPENTVSLTPVKPTQPSPAPAPSPNPGAENMIRIDMNKICQTSGWYNNCGLNCMTHFMFTKLSDIPQKQFARFLKENPEYDSFLATFQGYYNLQQKPNWQDVLSLLAGHTRSDREAIFAPVLRAHISNMMPKFAMEFFNTKFAGALSDYVVTGRVNDIANPVFASNKAFFEQYRTDFTAELESAKARAITTAEREQATKNLQAKQKNIDFPDFVITEEAIIDNIQLMRKSAVEDKMLPSAELYWMAQGCKAYADHMASLENAEMISADQLQWIGQRFNIAVEVYTPASMLRAIDDPELGKINHGMQWMPHGQYKWTMRVHNSGVHWTFEEANENQAATDEHNARFYTDGNKESQYKKIGNPESAQAIKKSIQGIMNGAKTITPMLSASTKKAPEVAKERQTAKRKKNATLQ